MVALLPVSDGFARPQSFSVQELLFCFRAMASSPCSGFDQKGKGLGKGCVLAMSSLSGTPDSTGTTSVPLEPQACSDGRSPTPTLEEAHFEWQDMSLWNLSHGMKMDDLQTFPDFLLEYFSHG